MKLIQYKGPFAAGTSFEVKPQVGYRYVHIGLQAPFREPVRQIVSKSLPTDFEITDSRGNSSKFRINDTDMLEFDGVSMAGLTIKTLQNLPLGSTIDVMYTMEED